MHGARKTNYSVIDLTLVTDTGYLTITVHKWPRTFIEKDPVPCIVTDHSTGALGGSSDHPPDRWFCSWAQRMSSPPRICNTETRDMGTRGHVGLSPERDHGVERGPASL